MLLCTAHAVPIVYALVRSAQIYTIRAQESAAVSAAASAAVRSPSARATELCRRVSRQLSTAVSRVVLTCAELSFLQAGDMPDDEDGCDFLLSCPLASHLSASALALRVPRRHCDADERRSHRCAGARTGVGTRRRGSLLPASSALSGATGFPLGGAHCSPADPCTAYLSHV